MAAATLLAAWALPVAAGLRGYYGTRQGFDWRTVAAVLDTVVPARDPVVATVGAAYPLRHYWRPDVRVLAAGDLAARLAGPAPGPVWVVVHLGWDRPDGLDAWLEARAVPVAEVPPSWSQPGVRVWRLRSASRPPTSR
jgi:hypothetical protein